MDCDDEGLGHLVHESLRGESLNAMEMEEGSDTTVCLQPGLVDVEVSAVNVFGLKSHVCARTSATVRGRRMGGSGVKTSRSQSTALRFHSGTPSRLSRLITTGPNSFTSRRSEAEHRWSIPLVDSPNEAARLIPIDLPEHNSRFPLTIPTTGHIHCVLFFCNRALTNL